MNRLDLPFERGAGAKRDKRHAVVAANAHDIGNIGGRAGKHDGSGRHEIVHPLAPPMRRPHRSTGRHPITKARDERGHGGGAIDGVRRWDRHGAL